MVCPSVGHVLCWCGRGCASLTPFARTVRCQIRRLHLGGSAVSDPQRALPQQNWARTVSGWRAGRGVGNARVTPRWDFGLRVRRPRPIVGSVGGQTREQVERSTPKRNIWRGFSRDGLDTSVRLREVIHKTEGVDAVRRWLRHGLLRALVVASVAASITRKEPQWPIPPMVLSVPFPP